MKRALPVISALAVAALGLAALWGGAPPTEALRHALSGFAGALIWSLAATGLGGVLLQESRAGEAFAMGVGVLGLVLLPVGMLGLLAPFMLAGIAVAASATWVMRPEIVWPAPQKLALAVALPFVLIGALDALAPPVDTDEIYQHLALPSQMLHTRGLVGGLLMPDGSRPLPIHMLYTGLLALGGEAAPKLFHLALAGVLLMEVHSLGRKLSGAAAGLLGVLALLGSYTFVRELGLAYNNLPTALFCLLGLRAALEGRGWRMALFCGFALAIKYTAAPVVTGIYLLWWWRGGAKEIPRLALFTAVALGMVAPWWLRNVIDNIHPLFPYAGWPESDRFAFTYLERYGMGRDLLSTLMLPWNMSVHADPTNYTFLGRISPVGLALFPAVILAIARGHRAVAGVAAVALVGWAVGAQWLRYLLPAAPIVAVALGQGFALLPRWGQGVALLIWLAGLPSNLGPWLAGVAERAPVALGQVDREALLADAVPGWGSVKWINEHSPADTRLALLFAWPGYYLERPYVLGSVEDHVPTRHLLYLQGENTLQMLQDLGVTHVMAGRVHFIKKSYPFLDDATFQEQFVQPEEQLDALLLEHGVLVHEARRYGVWRLK